MKGTGSEGSLCPERGGGLVWSLVVVPRLIPLDVSPRETDPKSSPVRRTLAPQSMAGHSMSLVLPCLHWVSVVL